jgi:lysyl-tRNA synthetase class 2
VKNSFFKPSMSFSIAQQRALILQKIRIFFAEKDILEVETPLLCSGTVTDVYLDAFECNYTYTHLPSKKFYLQTSPEFSLKRLLASGYGDIFQLSKAFRDEECGRHHNAEFTLLEWYRLGFDHLELMDEVAELLTFILSCDGVDKITYQQLFIDYVGVDPLLVSQADLRIILNKNNILSDWLVKETSIDVLLQVILAEIIEPQIGQEKPCFIYDFPRSQASLAKISKENPLVAERFECYYRGIELVNGFHELTDAKEQLARFNSDNEQRKEKGLVEKPIDMRFIAALEAGLPECSGVALGIDRLVMLACNLDHIDQVLTFNTNKA